MTERPTDAQLQEWQALADAATPGTWGKEYSAVTANERITHIAHADPMGNGEADAAFIAAARAAVPALLAEVQRLRAQNTALRDVLADVPIDAIMMLYDGAPTESALDSVGEWLLDAAAVTVEDAEQAE
jgi:hypothetical protein